MRRAGFLLTLAVLAGCSWWLARIEAEPGAAAADPGGHETARASSPAGLPALDPALGRTPAGGADGRSADEAGAVGEAGAEAAAVPAGSARAQVHGRVRARVRPQKQYCVTLTSSDESEWVHRVWTASEGAFSFDGVRPGRYELTVGSDHTVGPFPRPLELRVLPGETVYLDDLLADFGRGVLSGRVLGLGDAGLKGVQVALYGDPGPAAPAGERGAELDRTSTDAEGSFAFDGNQPGAVMVVLEGAPPGHEPLPPRYSNVPVQGAVELEPWWLQVDQDGYDTFLKALRQGYIGD